MTQLHIRGFEWTKRLRTVYFGEMKMEWEYHHKKNVLEVS